MIFDRIYCISYATNKDNKYAGFMLGQYKVLYYIILIQIHLVRSLKSDTVGRELNKYLILMHHILIKTLILLVQSCGIKTLEQQQKSRNTTCLETIIITYYILSLV